MSFDSLLIHTCDIGALAQGAVNNYGTPAKTWPAAYTDEPCRIMPTKAREILVGAKVMISDWTLFIDGAVVVDDQARISNIKSRASGVVIDASTYEVIGYFPRNNSITHHHTELALRKVA